MSDTLCWKCEKPGTGRCCWDRELTPVPGWTAREEEVDGYRSYHVIYCPEYQEMDWEARTATRMRLLTQPATRRNGLGLLILTQELLSYYDKQGMTLQQIHEKTGVPTGVIYARRMRSRSRAR